MNSTKKTKIRNPMSLNINNKSSLVNNSNEEFNYFTLNKKVFNELILIPRPKNTLFQIMVHLACMCRIPDDHMVALFGPARLGPSNS